MQVITGDNVFRLDYDKSNKCWTRWDIVYENKEANKSAKECWGMKDSKERFNNDYIWDLIKKYDENDALIAASKSNKGEAKDDDIGIVAGHTYTVKQVYKHKKF